MTKSGFRWAQLNSLEHDKIVDAIKHAFEGVGSDEKHRAARIKVKIRKYTRNPSKTLLPSYSLGSRNLSGRKVSNLKQITPRLEITKVFFFSKRLQNKLFSAVFKPSWMEIVSTCLNPLHSSPPKRMYALYHTTYNGNSTLSRSLHHYNRFFSFILLIFRLKSYIVVVHGSLLTLSGVTWRYHTIM